MQHLQLNRGTISLTERFLRNDMPLLARYLRNAMLTSEAEPIDLLLDRQHLKAINQHLDQLVNASDIGERSLLTNLLLRWSAVLLHHAE